MAIMGPSTSGTQAKIPHHIHEAFSSIVREQPRAVAITYLADDGSKKSLTYYELEAAAQEVANAIIRHG